MFLLPQNHTFELVRLETGYSVYKMLIPQGATIMVEREDLDKKACTYFKRQTLLSPLADGFSAAEGDMVMLNGIPFGLISDQDIATNHFDPNEEIECGGIPDFMDSRCHSRYTN